MGSGSSVHSWRWGQSDFAGIWNHLVRQGSPTFLAPGIGFVEGGFSTDQGGMVLGWLITFIVHFIFIVIMSAHLRSSGIRSWKAWLSNFHYFLITSKERPAWELDIWDPPQSAPASRSMFVIHSFPWKSGTHSIILFKKCIYLSIYLAA